MLPSKKNSTKSFFLSENMSVSEDNFISFELNVFFCRKTMETLCKIWHAEKILFVQTYANP